LTLSSKEIERVWAGFVGLTVSQLLSVFVALAGDSKMGLKSARETENWGESCRVCSLTKVELLSKSAKSASTSGCDLMLALRDGSLYEARWIETLVVESLRAEQEEPLRLDLTDSQSKSQEDSASTK
jgi:hypothetical protein